MDNGWVKLYRKSKSNPLMRDFTAWGVFSWIMLSVDRKTGEMIVGRFWASEYFEINPSTFYKALKRLEKKYKVISLTSNNRNTKIRVLNWAKYQEVETPVTTKEQQSNNKVTLIQEVENKEDINNNEKKSADFSDLKKMLDIPEKPVRGITQEFQAEGLRIAQALGAPEKRYSAYFKVAKEESRSLLLEAFGYAVDHPTYEARDKMFFWRLNQLKNEISISSN